MKRNLTLAEKKAVKAVIPSLDVDNYLIVKKLPGLFVLKSKQTGAIKEVPVQI
ncbi:hypothetical protein BSNK01_12430 [Bacillaceae bacterium]